MHDRQLPKAAFGIMLAFFLYLLSGGFWTAVPGGGDRASMYLVNKVTGSAEFIEGGTVRLPVRPRSMLAVGTAVVYLLLGAIAGAGMATRRWGAKPEA